MKAYQNRILLSILLAIGLLLLGGLIFPAMPDSSMDSERFWTNKTYPQQVYDMVVIGDSRIYRGINPDTMAVEMQALGDFRILNFGFSSAGLDRVFMDAGAELLDGNSKKRILVLGVTPSALADENMENNHYHQEKNRPAIQRWQRRNINPYFSYFDPSLPSMIRNQYRGEKEGYYQEHKDNGWIASTKIPKDVWKDHWVIQQSFERAEFSLFWQKKLIEKIKEWENQGIEVFAFRPPAVKHFEELEERLSKISFQAIAAQVEAVGGTWIDIENRYSYETYDGNHLEEPSAQRLSAYLARAIKNDLEKEALPKIINDVQNFDAPIQKPWTSLEPKHLSKETSYSGEQAHIVTSKAYSCTYLLPLDSLLQQNLYIRSSCWMKAPEADEKSKIVLVLSIEDSTGTILWKGQQFVEQALDKKEWNQINVKTNYEHNKTGCILKTYVLNNSNTAVLMDDLKITVLKE